MGHSEEDLGARLGPLTHLSTVPSRLAPASRLLVKGSNQCSKFTEYKFFVLLCKPDVTQAFFFLLGALIRGSRKGKPLRAEREKKKWN
jgi:hypothetical protein